MSEQAPETTPTDTGEQAPVRVPNVTPHAVSGLDHKPIGSNAQAAYDANQTIDAGGDPDVEEPLTVPADADAEGLLSWIADADDERDESRRTAAVENAEFAKDEPDADLLGALGWEPADETDDDVAWVRVSEDGSEVETVTLGEDGDEPQPAEVAPSVVTTQDGEAVTLDEQPHANAGETVEPADDAVEGPEGGEATVEAEHDAAMAEHDAAVTDES